MDLNQLQNKIISCQKCPRLIKHCKKIAQQKKKSFINDSYWGKPVPSFGDSNSELVIIGLAPAAHGANRTGRMFTGDRSGDWLYRALYKTGFANQPQSSNIQDGLTLNNAIITATAHCAPPDNKPTNLEIKNCSQYLAQELVLLKNAKVYLTLGKIAYDILWKLLNLKIKKTPFRHGLKLRLSENKYILTSYHPSQQNTFTKRLTEPMFDEVFQCSKKIIEAK